MHTKTRASAVKIYLFLLFISLFAVSGCGLDIDFGSGTDTGDAKVNEVITGFIEEVIPDTVGDSSLVVKASVVKDETLACCEDTTSVRSDFHIEGDLDPKAELEFFHGDSSLGVITIPVFPGAVLDIQNITIEDNFPKDDYYVNIDIEGQAASKSCLDDTSSSGNMKVEISSEGKETEVRVNLTSATDIKRGDDEDLPCEEIVEGRKVKIMGKLRSDEAVNAEEIEIL